MPKHTIEFLIDGEKVSYESLAKEDAEAFRRKLRAYTEELIQMYQLSCKPTGQRPLPPPAPPAPKCR